MFAGTQSYPLVVCAGLDMDFANLGVSFPGGLAESNCVAIDVCAEVNSRGELVPRDTWVHRSNSALVYDGEIDLAATGVYNYDSIEYVRAPAGIKVETCAPEYGHLKLTGEYVCNDRTVTNVTGSCPPISYAGEAFDLSSCLAAVQYDKQGVHQASLHGTTQLLRYSFEAGWGCLETGDTAANSQLSSGTKPNTLIPCTDIAHATYPNPNSCDFVCEPYYTKSGNTCLPNCETVVELSCATDHHATEECNLMDPPRYTCQPCAAQPGQKTLPWDANDAQNCRYEDCTAGTYGFNGDCLPCDINTFSAAKASSCSACPRGQHQPLPGQELCVDCFSESVDTSSVCADGEMLLRDVQMLDSYYQNLTVAQQSTYDLLAFCAQSYACVPCKPGHYEDGQTCQPCPYATYQPNFQHTSCFDCSAGQNTSSQGSVTAESCVCNAGFE